MAVKILTPNPTRPALKQTGEVSEDIRFWMQQVSDLQIIIGQGSPEGVIQSRQGAQYMDETASTGSILYIKKLSDIGGDKSLGWVLV